MRSQPSAEKIWLDDLSPEEFEEYERRFRWIAEQARPEQITPDGDWKTWLYLAGRGAGKTRSAAEDVAAFGLDRPKSRIAVVAETFADGRDVCIEGESGLLGVLPESSVRHWNRSLGELLLNNGTRYKIYSGDKPNQLRGPQHHRGWCDELAKYIYADETWTQLQLGLRLGEDPRCVVTTTPRPISLIRDLVERDNVVITSGSTFDNAANLADSFLQEVRIQYEGTPLGDQELYGKIVLLDGESIFKSDWWAGKNRYAPEEASELWNQTVPHGRFAALDTANTVGETSAYTALTVGDIQPDWRMALRHVARKKLEFPDLVDWTVEELWPFVQDRKFEALLIENAASGTQLIQQLRATGPRWLASRVVSVPPNRGPNGKESGWKNAATWAKRGMVLLPHPSHETPWLYEFQKELFEVPNSTYKDQADSFSVLVNQVEAHTGAFSGRWRALEDRVA